MRLAGLDIFRGVAIVLMVIFHFCFDLNNFHVVHFDLKHGDFWKYYRYLIVTMFVFTSGISLKLTHKDFIKFDKVKKRVIILALASMFVSVGSYTQFPDSWIYFGILHFFLFSSIFGLFFLKVPKTSLALAIVILFGYYYDILNTHWLFNLLQKPLHLPIYYTEDLATIFPWFGLFLLGIVFSHYKLHYKVFNLNLFNYTGLINHFFSFIGKHSLLIYLIHQPILFGFFTLYN